jgi:hypothetical protein
MLYEPEAHQVQGDCALSARHQNTAPDPLGPQKIIGAMTVFNWMGYKSYGY